MFKDFHPRAGLSGLWLRLRTTWNLLRGRPVMYRVIVYANVDSNVWIPSPENDGLYVVSCSFNTTEAEGDAVFRFGPTDQLHWLERQGVKAE